MNNIWKHSITTINLALMICLGFPHRVMAEDPGACFMVTSSGRTVELGKLCSQKTAPPDNDNTVVRVPIKRHLGRTPVIDVTFNNNQTFEMIVDTGASSTLITSGMASQLKLQTIGKMQAKIADGSQVEFLTGKVKSIEVGGAIANNLEVAIAPRGVIGLLGHDFFGNYDIKILEQQVEFHRR